jgi:hypothetical protein
MKHIKHILNDTNTYGVDMTFIINENNNYVSGTTTGVETELELKTIFENLDRMGLIKKYNKPTEVIFFEGGFDNDGIPIIDLYFDVDGERDDDNTPVCSITKEFLQELGF